MTPEAALTKLSYLAGKQDVELGGEEKNDGTEPERILMHHTVHMVASSCSA